MSTFEVTDDAMSGQADPVASILAAHQAQGRAETGALRGLSRDILWACAARQLDAEAQTRLGALCRQMSDDTWGQFVTLAHTQGMAPLVFEHVARAGLLDTMPDAIRAQFARDYQQTLVNNRRMKTVLMRVLSALAARRIPVVPLKGLMLAERLYGNMALRPMSDIDLLVRRADVGHVIQILRALGFAPAEGLARPTGFYALTSAVVVYAQANGITIEVHWELFGTAAYRAALPAPRVWHGAQPLEYLGQPVYGLDLGDELRYLCVHAAAQHRLARLIWLADIAELVRSLPDGWDWPAFAAATRAAGTALPVAVALAFCHEALGLALPSGILDELRLAGAGPAEQAAWDAVSDEPLSQRWIINTSAHIHGPLQWAIFLRGVLLPRAPTLLHLYPAPPRLDPLRLRTYAGHWRRTVPWALRAARARRGPHVDTTE